MKKIYLSILSIILVAGVNSQTIITNSQQNKMLLSKHEMGGSNPSRHTSAVTARGDRAVLWDDDFSNPSTWVMANTSAPISWNWEITTDQSDIPNAAPSLQPFQSATAGNGFALINSDGQPGNVDGDGAINATITNATPIDLTGEPNVILKFSHSYRWWQESRGVRVSGNNGATWTDFPITSLVGGAIATGYPNDQNSENPVVESINISAVAGGQSQVLVQFYYNDNNIWAWYWVVDDVEIIEQPDNDIQLLAGWFAGANNEGVEYGRTPLFHADNSYLVGAQVYNFGINDQTNVALNANFTSFSSNSSDPLLENDSTTFIENSVSPTLALGTYSGTYTVVSDQETTGPEFGNNVYQRNFEITEELYSQDGIGIHPVSEQVTGSIGTGSFAGSDDGLVLASMYHIKATDDVVSITVMLDPATTVAGGSIDATIKDTINFLANDMTSLYFAPSVTVTATDVTNGFVTINFPPGTTLAPGAYYAAVELFSNAGANDIRVLDDRTITQPFWASAIYIPSDQSYTNGEAYGIRLRMAGGDASINNNELPGVSIYPNPAVDFTTIHFDVNQYHNMNVELFNTSGQVIYSSVLTESNHRLGLENVAAGVYVVKVTADEGTMTQKLVVSK